MGARESGCGRIALFRGGLVEQQAVDALRRGLEFRAAQAVQIELVAVDLGAQPARVGRENGDAAAHHQGLFDGVGDEDQREAELLPQRQQLFLHAAARERIQRGEGLVHQQHARLHRKGAGDGHALLHAARELVRMHVGELREAHLVEVERRALGGLGAARAARGEQREHHVLAHRLPGRQLVELLEDDHAVRAGLRHRLPVQQDAPFAGRDEARDGLEQRGLAAARGAEQHQPLALMHVEAHAVRGAHGTLRRAVVDAHALHAQQWRRGGGERVHGAGHGSGHRRERTCGRRWRCGGACGRRILHDAGLRPEATAAHLVPYARQQRGRKASHAFHAAFPRNRRRSAAACGQRVVEEIVLERFRPVLDRSHAVQELAQAERVLGLYLELHLGVPDDLEQQRTVGLRARHLQIDVGSLLGVGGDELGRVMKPGEEGLVGLGALLAEFLGGVEHRGGRGATQHVVGVEHDVRLGIAGQLLLLERRVAEVAGDLGAALDDRGGRIGVRHGDLQPVEPVEFLVAPELGGGELQHARLHRHAHRRQRDAVLVGEVSDGLHGRVVADEVVREVAERGHALDVLPPAGAVPQREERAHAGPGDVDAAREQRIVHGGAARELEELHLDVHARGLAVLLDQLLVLRHVEKQIDDAELLGDAQPAFFGLGDARSRQARGQQAGRRGEGGGLAHEGAAQ